MFERFSSGYYLGRLYVTPREDDGERAAIARAHHEQVNEQLYADDDEAITRTDLPLVMKLENTHLAVHGDDGVPERTLALPPDLVAETGVHNPPSLREVFLAKAERARQLLSLASGLPGAGDHTGDADDANGPADDPLGFDGGPTGI